MANEPSLEKEQIAAALAELEELSVAEYGVGLEALLRADAPTAQLRLQRLVGIVLKRPFADPEPRTEASETSARRAWPWKAGSPEASAAAAPEEFKLLNDLRLPGPWNEQKALTGTDDDRVPVPWESFQDEVARERGLFKILALYVNDKLEGRDGKRLRDYLEAEESRRFEAGLDIATIVFDSAVTAPLVSLLGIPTLAVSFALVALRFGYRKITDPSVARRGDKWS